MNLTDGASPPKPAAKRRRERFSSPQPRLFGDRDVNDLANSMGRSPMLDNNNNNEITMLKNRVDEIFGGVGNVKLIKRMKESVYPRKLQHLLIVCLSVCQSHFNT